MNKILILTMLVVAVPLIVQADYSSPYSDSTTTSGLWHMNSVRSVEYIDDDISAGARDNALIILDPNTFFPGGPTLVDPSAHLADPNVYPAGNSDFGKCLAFDGVDGGGAISNSLLFLDPNNVRIESWFKAEADVDGQILFDRWGQMVLYLHSDMLRVRAWDIDGVPMYYNYEFAPADANSTDWKHIAVEVIDNQVEAFINNVSAGSYTLPGGLSKTTTRNTTYIARRYNNTANFKGCIDEMKIGLARETDCGMWGYLDGDINLDCVVDVNDLSLMAFQWLGSTDPNESDAVHGRIEAYSTYNSYNIPKTDAPPTIDGTFDTDEWDDAKIISIVYPDIMKTPNVGSLRYDEPTSPSDLSAYYHYKWDDEYLYVGIKVYDDTLVFYDGYPDDYVALGINLNGAATELSDVAYYAMYIDSAGDPNIDNAAWYNQAFNPVNADIAASTLQEEAITVGWSFEVAFLWADLGGYDPIVGDTHGFVAFLCDNDDNDINPDTFLYDSGTGETDAIGTPSAYRVVTLTESLVCGDFGYVESDIDANCAVNLADFAEIASYWMGCSDPVGVDCVDTR